MSTARRLIGYWATADGPSALPDPRDLIDESWEPRERRLVGAYLSNGTLVAQFRGNSTCRVCGAENGSSELTDGTFQWPQGLAHYVAEHGVRLPPQVVEHIGERAASIYSNPASLEWWVAATQKKDPTP